MSTKNIEDAYPLSPIQEGMIFYNLLDDSGVNVSQLVCRLEDLNVAAFAEAWRRVIERHPILRTAFVWKKLERPLQVVGRKVSLPLAQLDWRGLDSKTLSARLDEYVAEDRGRGFNPSKAPLMRLALMRVDEGSHYFLWSHHHLLLDGWSKHIIIKELLELYQASSRGEEMSLPPTRPYRDYIAWLQQQDAASAESFWREKLKGFTAPNALPTDRPLGGAQTSAPRYEETRLRLSQTLTAELQAFAREHQLTLNTVVQGAWTLMLSRYSGERDIVFGAVSAQRPTTLAGVEGMVGLFINTLPVRVEVDEQTGLSEWLRRLQEQQAAARQYEYSSLVDVQGWGEVPRGVALFESMLAFENYPVDDALREPSESLKISSFTNVERSSYPLTLVAGPGLELSLKIIYDCRYFDAPTVERILGHTKKLLQGMVDNPAQRLAALTLLSPDERRELLAVDEGTRAEYPSDRCLHELFEAQAERTPDAVAVVFKETRLTYAELNGRANQLARHLRAEGAGAGVRVAVCLDHSIEMVVAVLGVLKAGAAYVPLDPSYPLARLAFMLKDAAAPVLLTEQGLLAELPTDAAVTFCLDTDWPTIAQQSTENLTATATPQDLAYVIYTSGSTGEPKGVQISHRSAVNYVWWAAESYLRGESLDFALYSSLSFDLTVTSIYTPLVTGNRVLVYRKEGRDSQLFDILRDNRVGVLKLTPSHLSLIKDDEHRGSRIKRLIVGGEALDTALARAIHESFGGGVEIYNEYGPTEATVGCMIHRYDPEADERAQVPIGRPAANTQVYVLDSNLEPVAENVVGELYIAGDGLAEGYLNREELTAERFVAHPSDATRRMYRSGDLARRLGGGVIEYVGRRDEQVKYHGYRVELSEIRDALNRLPQVRDSVVKVVKDKQGRDLLVAYYVSRQEMEAARLRELLKEQIIEETIPNIFVHLKKLPLTLNGKVNHRALPTLEEARERVRREYVAARSATEEILAQIWADVLGVGQIGVHDNFFELGGHSLLATQITSRIREAFKVEMSLRSLFESPTVGALAQTVEKATRDGQGDTLPPVVPVPRDGELPLSFAQQRLWFLNELTPDGALYNVSLAVRMRGDLNVGALEAALAEIVRRHEVLRTSFPTMDGRPAQTIAPSLEVPLTIIELEPAGEEGAREEEVRRFINREARTPFNLAEAPLLRVHLLRLAAEDFVLVCTIHHIISDGWTIGVMVRELGALYDAFSNNRPSPLAALPVQYADFAHWQRKWLGGEALEKQLAYWGRQLAAPSRPLELPFDRPRPEVPQYKGASATFVLSKELTEALRALGRQESVTLFMTMLAAFQTLLHRYSGSDEVSVGSPVANRSRAETEGLIGCFINTLVLRTQLSGNPSFREVLRRVREVTLGAYAHQDLPFEVLVEALQPERRVNLTPFFQVWLVVNNASRRSLELPGLTLSQINRDVWNAQFDLTLSLSEYEEGIGGTLTYDTSLFDEATALSMIEHLQALLEAVTADPEQPILDIPLVGAEAEGEAAAPELPNRDLPEDRFEFSPR
jgi:amino acid adenylation domain-containing protein